MVATFLKRKEEKRKMQIWGNVFDFCAVQLSIFQKGFLERCLGGICPLFCRNLFCVETRTAARWLPRTFALDLADVHQIWCLTKEPLTIYVFGSWFLEQVWNDVNVGSVACRLIQRSRKSCPTFLLAGRMLMMLELANADKKLRLLCPGLQPEWSFQRSETGPTDQEQFAMAAVSEPRELFL